MIKLTSLFAIFAVTILLTGTTAGPLAIMQPAEALKSQGTYTSVINSKKVCGDRLCSEIPQEEKVKESEPGEWIIGRGWHQEKWDEALERRAARCRPWHLSASDPWEVVAESSES